MSCREAAFVSSQLSPGGLGLVLELLLPERRQTTPLMDRVVKRSLTALGGNYFLPGQVIKRPDISDDSPRRHQIILMWLKLCPVQCFPISFPV